MRSTSVRKYFQGAIHTGSSCGSKSVSVGATDKNGAGAQTQRLHDIASSSDASIHQHFHTAIDCRNNFRQVREALASTPSNCRPP